jgi:hypothetical protein
MHKLLFGFMAASVIPASQAFSMTAEGQAALERIVEGEKEVIDMGLHGPLNPTDPEFQANARCTAYYLMKELEVLGQPGAKAFKETRMRYFMENVQLAEARGYHYLEPLSYAGRAMEVAAHEALGGKIEHPGGCHLDL